MQHDGLPAKLPPDLPSGLDDPLPTPAERLDSLVLWLGDNMADPTASDRMPAREVEAWTGARIRRAEEAPGLVWLLRQEETVALLETHPPRLKMKGWERYHALKRGRVESRKAFMAMKFGAKEVELAYTDCFQPAVARAGFELFDMREQQKAGMIDDLMRVAIRNSRFLIADLSHECRGSYWEGGFAEGLGRPVIYTCNSETWEKEKSHFDTNHLATVVWDANNFEKAARELTAIIRNTLPDEAKMND